MQTRRSLLAGGVAAGATALAGCSASFEFGDEDPPPFAVDRLAFTSDRVEEYGGDDPRQGPTYTRGELIWMYVELANVTPEDEADIDLTVELFDPEGAIVAENDQAVSIDRLEEPPNEAFVTEGIDTAVLELADPGEYEVSVTVSERATGTVETVDGTVTLEQFSLPTIAFAATLPDDPSDDLREQPAATYDPGEDVIVYTELEGAPIDRDRTARLTYTYEVTDPEGGRWETTTVDETDEDAGFKTLRQWQAFRTFPDDPAGEHRVTVSVEDRVLGATVESTDTFELA